MAMSTGSEPRRPRFNLLSGPDLSANGMLCVARGKALFLYPPPYPTSNATGFYESTTSSRGLDFILLRSISILVYFIYIYISLYDIGKRF